MNVGRQNTPINLTLYQVIVNDIKPSCKKIKLRPHEVRQHRPLTRYAKLRVAHAPGRPGTFSPPSRVHDPDSHHGTCVTHVPWCMPGSLTSGFLWSGWRGKRSRHSRRMRNPQSYASGKRPITDVSRHWWINTAWIAIPMSNANQKVQVTPPHTAQANHQASLVELIHELMDQFVPAVLEHNLPVGFWVLSIYLSTF